MDRYLTCVLKIRDIFAHLWRLLPSCNFEHIIISEKECTTLESRYMLAQVVTEATLPVQHGAEITITATCPSGYVADVGDQATCLYGQLVPTTKLLFCSFISMCLCILFIRSIFINSNCKVRAPELELKSCVVPVSCDSCLQEHQLNFN